MARTLTGRRLLITGASSGIGRALAWEAARRGCKMVLTARSADLIEDQARELSRSARAIAFPADITRPDDRCRLIEAAREHLGGLDILINNAGIASFGHFAESTESILRQIMDVNFFAPAEIVRLAVPILQEGIEPAIVNIASMCGRRGLPAWSEYSASKFALVGLAEALRAELVRFGIDVVVVLPGLTNTGLGQHMLRNEGRMKIDYSKGMSPEEVAAGTLDALEANRREIVLGREARWMLRINRFFPGLVNRLLVRKVAQLYAHS